MKPPAPLGVVQPGDHGHLHGRHRYPHDCGCSACATDWWDNGAHNGGIPRKHGTVGRWAMGCRCPKCETAWDTYEAAGGGLEWKEHHTKKRPR